MRDSDESSNPSNNAHLLTLNASRRRLLMGGLGALALSAFGVPPAVNARAATRAGRARPVNPRIGFASIEASFDDAVHVPNGYSAIVLYRWGEPVSDGPPFKQDASNSAADQAEQAGMHHDGMHFFPLSARKLGRRSKRDSQHGVLCINHEYVDDGLLHTTGLNDWSAEKVAKSKAAHGVSIIEVKQVNGAWYVVRPSTYARRITATTPMRLSGPAAGSALTRTEHSPAGLDAEGTFNNCAMGFTPWGTHLTCEENFHFYFANASEDIPADHRRYGIGGKNSFNVRWHEFDERFDAAKHPNMPNHYGWVVEIDPFDARRKPVKRTALGRFKHEGACTVLAPDRRIVVYMGDDERFEYIYKFVSRDKFNPKNRLANWGLLDHGTLYAARFDGDGGGRWLPLIYGENGIDASSGFSSQADVCVRARMAADIAGATKMDRPEWIAVHSRTREVYVTLTNNSQRGKDDKPSVNAANPRTNNTYGHIVRWEEAERDPAATDFEWDIFVECGDPAHEDPYRQGNIDGDLFGSPDSLCFDKNGVLWIQTDVSSASLGNENFQNMGNNQMLAADVRSGEIKRFLTGPRGCEITGACFTPDSCTMFVNIQHPGETGNQRSDPNNPTAISSWPDGARAGRPRSATIAIQKDDGGEIGT